MLKRSSPPLVIALLLGLCAFVVLLHYGATRRGGLSAPESGVFLVLRPVQKTLTAVGDWSSDVGRALFRRPSIVSENKRLQGEVDNLRNQSQRLQRYRAENVELRRLLQMPKPRGGTIRAADIISLDATDFARRVVLNIGSRQGVRSKDVVFNAQGVVGQVATVSPLSCVVLLLTDRMSGVGAMTGRTMAKGVVKGSGERVCKMSYLDYRADVREGDLVLTSGNSEIFPKGLVIGRVLKIERDKRYSQLTAYIDPAVAFDRLSAVYVRVQAG
ncbi:MAG TPA: rod shape-determining protein MreC [Abditibacteriaceae bacterium]|jgi:rod shape-determining protein MreC